ncbi:hypothetical protein [Paenibacillus silviterrae]|uniref:hypothetical protein n=1 Tax=Paenibacillus silviterrae TaxID=3242194 RepID=UPI002542AA83|nr:hypothetical protein [Paenibacillus chinjuensis]
MLGANPWFLISCFFNIGWLLLWHQLQIAASVFAMLGLLFSLIGCYLGTRPQGISGDPVIRLLVQLPFSVYLGWISVATIVNSTVALSAAGWNGFGWSGTVWTVILLAVAAVLALLIGSRYHDPAYVLVFVWAFIAIGAANLRLDPIVAYASWTAALLLLGFALWLLLSNRQAHTSAAA